MTNRTLTLGLPVHNAMPYLPEALDSVFAQTVQDFEVLAIVDGSADGSLAYLRSIHDERLRIIEQPHCGLAFTLNRMLRECRTPWLIRQDADDLSAPERLQEIQRAIADHPQAGMFYSNAAYHPVGKSVGMFRCTRGTPQQIRSLTQSGYVPAICHPSAVLHVERTLALGGYRSGLQCEDADLWWRMALAHDVHFIPKVLLHFRQSNTSLTAKNLKAQALDGLYVQYLLLSQLHGRTPSQLQIVEKPLLELLARESLSAKEKLRLFNIQMGRGEWFSAIRSFCGSLLESPTYVLRRLLDELMPSSAIGNGLAPHLFQKKAKELWPQFLST